MAKLIFGCGYLGGRVARRWVTSGEKVFAVTRGQARVERLTSLGVGPVVADITDRDSLRYLPAAETVLFAVGFDRSSGHSIHDVYVQGLHNVLDALPPDVRRFIYVSSTGVFGQSHGEWVDEQAECRPTREGGRACLAAEQLLASHPIGRRSVVLRMAGIYGPGRIPRGEDLRAGRPIAAAADGFLNLIHVEDAAAVVVRAELVASPPALYLVSDGQPVVRRDYFCELARLARGPEPQFQSPPADAPAARRAATDKRVDNSRALRELQCELSYPNYKVGLAAIMADDSASQASATERESQ